MPRRRGCPTRGNRSARGRRTPLSAFPVQSSLMCIFCDDVARSGDLVYEDEETWVVLHPDWAVRGHAMVVSRRHVENISDLTVDEWVHFARVLRWVEGVLLELTGADRAIQMKLGIATPHLHLHLYPVSSEATREEVFDAIDAKTPGTRDAHFVGAVTEALLTPPPE